MSSEEVPQTLQEQPLEGEAVSVPLQVKKATVSIPRPIDIMGLIHQWQPMGIRITLKFPFVSNDWGYLFLIRNGPFIPRHNHPSEDINLKLDTTRYAFNNLRNVFLLPSDGYWNDLVSYPDNYPLSLSVYDYPPMLSTLAQCFRRWRGDMQYRVRVVAGFGTQGYLVAGNLKNEVMPVGIYDEYSATPNITRLDASYRQMMMNGYVMSDTSMFRHLEVTVPYDYPTEWYDQYQWIANRCTPRAVTKMPSAPDKFAFTNPRVISEISGDDFVAVGVRGSIESRDTATMVFELEYRAAEGFQFAEPGLPPWDMMADRRRIVESQHPYDMVKTMPSKEWRSDGVSKITANKLLKEAPTSETLPPILNNLAISASVPPIRSRSPPKLQPVTKDHISTISGKKILYPAGHPLGPFKSCAVDRRGGNLYTHCQREDLSWVSFYDDVRSAIQIHDTEHNLWSDRRLRVVSEEHLRGLAKTAREQEFT